MSDYNTGTQLAVLGFADQPGLVGKVVADVVGPVGCVGDVVGRGSGRDGPSAVHQHMFVLRDGQFHPAAPTAGPDVASHSASNLDFNPIHHQPKNIRFVTLALHSGPVITHHTVELNAMASTGDMDQFVQVARPLLAAFATQLITVTVGTNATGQQQFMAVSWGGVAKLIRELGPTIFHDVHILHPDGTVFVFTDSNGTGTGAGHEAFLGALDRCADHALPHFNVTAIIMVLTIVSCLGMVAGQGRQRG